MRRKKKTVKIAGQTSPYIRAVAILTIDFNFAYPRGKDKKKTYFTLCLTLHHRRKWTNALEVKCFRGPKEIFTWIDILWTSSSLRANFFKSGYTTDKIQQLWISS